MLQFDNARLTGIVEINNIHDGASSPFGRSTSRRSRAPSAGATNISALYSFALPDNTDHHPDIETRFTALREPESQRDLFDANHYVRAAAKPSARSEESHFVSELVEISEAAGRIL
jgi:hypothetical protein